MRPPHNFLESADEDPGTKHHHHHRLPICRGSSLNVGCDLAQGEVCKSCPRRLVSDRREQRNLRMRHSPNPLSYRMFSCWPRITMVRGAWGPVGMITPPEVRALMSLQWPAVLQEIMKVSVSVAVL